MKYEIILKEWMSWLSEGHQLYRALRDHCWTYLPKMNVAGYVVLYGIVFL